MFAHLRFDLVPLRDAYRQSYGPGPAQLGLRLTELYAMNHAPLFLTYRF